MTDERRPVVVVGAGLIGAKRAAALDPRQQLVSVVDLDLDRASALAGKHAVTATDDYASTLDRQPGALVIVATTHQALTALAQPAAAAGHHLLIEKPGARNAGELRPVLDIARTNGTSVRVGYNHRFHPGIRALRAGVTSGEYGPVKVVRARYGHGGRPGYESEWRAQRELSGGGELLDQGSHLLDLTRFVAGDLAAVDGFVDTLHWPMDVEDNAFVTARLDAGGRAWLHASWSEWKNLFSFEVFCGTAKFEVNGLGGSYGAEQFRKSHMLQGFGPPEVTTIQYAPGDDSWALEMTDVEDAIRGSASIGASGDDALAVLAAIGEVYANDH